MYCKQCGHRAQERTAKCEKCGATIGTTVQLGDTPKRKVRRGVVVATVLISVILFFLIPRVFFRTELESIGPTDKLRFLRAIENSEYRRFGQRDVQLNGHTLIIVWDLTWNVLPDTKQKEIVRIVGHAWEVVGGLDTRFRVEGADSDLASFEKGEVHLSPAP